MDSTNTTLAPAIDSFFNALSGVGVSGRDRRLESVIVADNIQPTEARSLWEGSRTAGVIVDRVAEDMTRQWVNQKLADPKHELAFDDRVKQLNVKAKFLDATRSCRMVGGSILVVVTEDAIDNTEALALPMPKKPVLHCLTKFDAGEVSSWSLETNPTSASYGLPVQFQVSPATGAPSFKVHASRCLVFAQPVSGPTQSTNHACFGPSCFEGMKEAILNFDSVHNHLHAIAESFGIRVHSVAGLMAKVAQDGGAVFGRRLSMLQMSASAIRSYLIDKDNESIDSTAPSVAGLPDLVHSIGSFLSTQSRIPQAILLGDSPGGLNSTGNVELESYYTFCKGQQEQVIRPALTRLLQLLSIELGLSEPHFEFAPLWSPSAAEVATMEKTEQDKFLVLAQNMAILAEHGAMSGDEFRAAAKANPLLAKFLEAPSLVKGE